MEQGMNKRNLLLKKARKAQSGFAIVATLILSATLFSSGIADPKEAEFIGAKKCKMCHNKKATGKQYAIWTEAKHSKAFDLLGTDRAKTVAAKLGIKDPQASGKCLKCHSTVYKWTDSVVSNVGMKKSGKPRITVAEGVSCESCHNAGSLYQKKKIMQDFDKSVAAGLNPHPEENCVKCHNSDNPTWNPKKYTLKDSTTTGFDFDQAWEKIKHPNPKRKSSKSSK